MNNTRSLPYSNSGRAIADLTSVPGFVFPENLVLSQTQLQALSTALFHPRAELTASRLDISRAICTIVHESLRVYAKHPTLEHEEGRQFWNEVGKNVSSKTGRSLLADPTSYKIVLSFYSDAFPNAAATTIDVRAIDHPFDALKSIALWIAFTRNPQHPVLSSAQALGSRKRVRSDAYLVDDQSLYDSIESLSEVAKFSEKVNEIYLKLKDANGEFYDVTVDKPASVAVTLGISQDGDSNDAVQGSLDASLDRLDEQLNLCSIEIDKLIKTCNHQNKRLSRETESQQHVVSLEQSKSMGKPNEWQKLCTSSRNRRKNLEKLLSQSWNRATATSETHNDNNARLTTMQQMLIESQTATQHAQAQHLKYRNEWKDVSNRFSQLSTEHDENVKQKASLQREVDLLQLQVDKFEGDFQKHSSKIAGRDRTIAACRKELQSCKKMLESAQKH